MSNGVARPWLSSRSVPSRIYSRLHTSIRTDRRRLAQKKHNQPTLYILKTNWRPSERLISSKVVVIGRGDLKQFLQHVKNYCRQFYDQLTVGEPDASRLPTIVLVLQQKTTTFTIEFQRPMNKKCFYRRFCY